MDEAFVKKLLRYAKHYLQLGMHPVPVLIEAKKSILLGWPDLRLKQEDLVQYFGDGQNNLGILLGIDGLADADADSREAVLIARHFLPPTDWLFGRVSKRESHHIYR